MLSNYADIRNLEDFIMTVARSREISNLKSYSLRIISDYAKFFNLILPKDVREVLIDNFVCLCAIARLLKFSIAYMYFDH